MMNEACYSVMVLKSARGVPKWNIYNVSLVILVQPNKLEEDLSFVVVAIQILDRKEQELRNKLIPLVLVLW